MKTLEILQSVQYVIVKGKRFAVLDIEDWEALVEWLENIEDRLVVQQAYEELQAAQSDREKAGWLKWDDLIR